MILAHYEHNAFIAGTCIGIFVTIIAAGISIARTGKLADWIFGKHGRNL